MAYKKSFEENMIEAEACINKMESDEVPLSESLALYKRGLELINFCDLELKEAQKEITLLDNAVPKEASDLRNKKS
ncbi:MAG: exodeoxyribonuclease VII small subunit [Phycisphaerae bacterium]|nr:exodeoxyribonuclease VII small subunit [Phycisphaerae bacterium]|tara:strand:- start:65 stop:292 length:228 start_codon:yes stop_codon:yes gene_type:complete